MQPSQVADTSGNFVGAGTLGSFAVSLTNLQASVAGEGLAPEPLSDLEREGRLAGLLQ